jgi:hypothetical protein
MYRFIECTVEKYMTRAVRTVTRQTTMRELEALFEKHDFNSFPVVSCRADSTIDASSSVDGESKEPQLSGYWARSPVARNDLSRGPDARTQRGNTGRLEPGIRTRDFTRNPNTRDVHLSASTLFRESCLAGIGH